LLVNEGLKQITEGDLKKW